MRRLKVAALWSGVAGAAAYLFLFDPEKGVGYFPCPFRSLTGFLCPGCGATRGLHQLLHGHPLTAFELNPLLMIALPFLVFALINATSSRREGALTRFSLSAKYGW